MLRWVEARDLAAGIAARRALARAEVRASLDQWLAVTPPETLDLLASFQYAVINELLDAGRRGREPDPRTSADCFWWRQRQCRFASRRAHGPSPYPVHFPPPGLATDNAAMIAAAAFPKLLRKEFAGFDTAAEARLTLA